MRFDNKAYEHALLLWLKAKKDHPTVNHDPEPNALDFGCSTGPEQWQAGKIRDRVMREINR